MRFLKYFFTGTGVWLVLFVIDYGIELFQIDETSIITTVMGLRIATIMTPDILDSTFTLTWQALLIYLAFIGVWIILSYLISKVKKAKEKEQ